MKAALVVVLALIASTTIGTYASGATPTPYAVTPRTVDWQCAINASQFAQGYLKNAGLIDPSKVDDDRTFVRLLLKKSFGHGRYEHVYFMVLHQTDGKSISIITESTTEDVECPSQDVKVYVVSHEFGHLPSLHWIPPDQPVASTPAKR